MIPDRLKHIYTKNKIIILVILAAIALICLTNSAMRMIFPASPPPQVETFKCVSCGDVKDLVIPDIHKTSERCKKCGGSYGYIYKCLDCSYEFGVVPPNIKPWTVNKYQMMEAWKNAASCPTCKSENTQRVTGQDLKAKKAN